MLRVGFQEKTGALPSVPREGNLPFLMPRKPQQRPSSQALSLPHVLQLPFDKPELGRDAWARALLVLGFSKMLYHECPSLESSAHQRCQGNVSTH